MARERPVDDAGSWTSSVVASASAAEYAAGDERLLAAGGPHVRVAVLAERCVSFGVGTDRGAGYLVRASGEGIPPVPRRTGGTGLLHEPGDLAWTVVLRRSDPRLGANFTRAYARLGRGAVRWLAALGVESAWEPAPGTAAEYCTLGARGSVLFVRGRILGGAAQHATRADVLHHGTISRTVDRGAIERIFSLPPGGPAAQLTALRDLGIDAEPPELARSLARSIADDLATE